VAISVDRPLPRIARPLDVAAIDNVDAPRDQGLGEASNAQRFRPHHGASIAGTDISRCAEQRYGEKTAHGLLRWVPGS
jgi:hypothetical protein